MSKPVDWEAIARLLGLRMYHHAYGCGHAHRERDCPFCEDTLAYEAFEKVAGKPIDPFVGRYIPLHEIPLTEDE